MKITQEYAPIQTQIKQIISHATHAHQCISTNMYIY